MNPMSSKALVAISFAAFAVFACACSGSKSAGNQDKDTVAAPVEGQKISVPGGVGTPTTATAGGSVTDDPRFHLQPEEGTLTIDKAEAKPGAEATAGIKIAPASGYHVATDYPIKISLEAPAGVTLAKAELTAGGRDKSQGDATALSEQGLAFAVKATADKVGAYEIKGTFKFGVCDKDSCHPKKQPITITVAVN